MMIKFFALNVKEDTIYLKILFYASNAIIAGKN